MHPKSTRYLVCIALGLFAFIYFFERHWHRTVVLDTRVLPGLKPESVKSITIQHAGQPAVRAERTNGGWQLTQPRPYPAQAAIINELLHKLADLRSQRVLTPQELRAVPKANEEYGFDAALFNITYEQGGETQQFKFGKLTAPGDQVYVQVVGRPDIDVVGLDIITNLPAQPNDWRDTTFVRLDGKEFDRLTVTNGTKVLVLQRTNGVWRMTQRDYVLRADTRKINELIYQLQQLQVTKFEAADDRGSLDTFGLQPPAWELAFFNGSNQVLAVQFGKSPTNDDAQIFARDSILQAVVQVTNSVVAPWRADYSQFRDPHLAGLITSPLDAIDVQGPGGTFTLQRQANDTWIIDPASRKWPADAEVTTLLLKGLINLEATNYINDTATELELTAYGLKTPARKYILRRAAAGPAGAPTNTMVAELDFGSQKDGLVYAQRGDLAESTYVYGVKAADLEQLPATMLALRQRRIWTFDAQAVVEVDVKTMSGLGQYNRLTEYEFGIMGGNNSIRKDRGFPIQAATDEFAVFKAQKWVGIGEDAKLQGGFSDKSPRIDLIFKDRSKLSLELGGLSPSGLRYGATQFEGQIWVFEIPSESLSAITTYLNITQFP